MSDVNTFFETMVFKIRYIVSMSADSKEITDIPCDLPDISFEKIGRHNLSDMKSIYTNEYSDAFLKSIEIRLKKPEIWFGYLVRTGDIPVAIFWWLVPTVKEELYDSFWVDTHSILYCSGIVHPHYRGKRIFNLMHSFTSNLLRTEYSNRNLFGIVEKRNTASLKSCLRSNMKIVGRNYLVKLFGRNVISIYKPNRGSTRIWLLLKKF